MFDFEDGFSFVEALSSKWIRSESETSQGILIELPNEIALKLHMSSKHIGILLKNAEEIYEYARDISFFNEENGTQVQLFSPVIEHVHFLYRKHVISNDLDKLKSVVVKLNLDKKLFSSSDQ